ncbi:hypothetical protein F5879DRAFT_812921 [Lentinula edodes]|nr:hypothetical protein F5879DRAFT_812921 [Lentinula edodes]
MCGTLLVTSGDIAFRSSNGVLFRIDKWRLALVSDAFPAVIPSSMDEVVELSENSNTLQILFIFAYPNWPIPDIGALSFCALVDLLNAADKYAFRAAIEISLSHLQKYAQAHSFEIMILAGKHNYSTLLAAVAPYLVDLKSERIAAMGFSADLCTKWVRFEKTLSDLNHT